MVIGQTVGLARGVAGTWLGLCTALQHAARLSDGLENLRCANLLPANHSSRLECAQPFAFLGNAINGWLWFWFCGGAVTAPAYAAAPGSPPEGEMSPAAYPSTCCTMCETFEQFSQDTHNND